MKILVISDTHSIREEFYQLVYDYRDDVDCIVHCGDSELPFNDTIWSMVDTFVKGNMDFDNQFVTETSLTTNLSNIYVTHGHFFNVNTSRNVLSQMALEQQCQIAFYGHTHILSVEKINNVICINPGSFNHSRGPVKHRTYAIVNIDEVNVHVEFYRHDKTKLSYLTQTIKR